MSGNRAFDTGSEKIWNTMNKGVCTIQDTDAVGANMVSSANGETLSSGTCRRPRMTSNCVWRLRRGEHELERCFRTRQWLDTVCWCILKPADCQRGLLAAYRPYIKI
jgi:hypothetical protein